MVVQFGGGPADIRATVIQLGDGFADMVAKTFRSSAHPAGPNELSYLKLNVCGSFRFGATSPYQNLYFYIYPHPGSGPYPHPYHYPCPPYLFVGASRPQ